MQTTWKFVWFLCLSQHCADPSKPIPPLCVEQELTPPAQFPTPFSKTQHKIKATTYHKCDFDHPTIRQSAENAIIKGFIVPAIKTEQFRKSSLFSSSSSFFFPNSIDYRTGTSSVKKLTRLHLLMPLHLQLAEHTSFRNPVLSSPLPRAMMTNDGWFLQCILSRSRIISLHKLKIPRYPTFTKKRQNWWHGNTLMYKTVAELRVWWMWLLQMKSLHRVEDEENLLKWLVPLTNTFCAGFWSHNQSFNTSFQIYAKLLSRKLGKVME